MKNARVLIGLGVLIIGVGVIAVLAQMAGQGPISHGPGAMRHRMMARVAEYLNLTDSQKNQIKSILESEKPAMQPLVQKLADGRDQIDAAAQAGNFDEVRRLADRQSKTIADLIVEREQIKSKIFAVLTSEQQAKAKELIQRWEQHRGQARQGWF